MYSEGHAGLSLAVFSPLIYVFKATGAHMDHVLMTYFLTVALSSLPDIDLRYRKYGLKHRGITHTFIFGAGVGILFSILMNYAFGPVGYLMGFIAGLGSTASHIFGDIFTKEALKPFRPFSDKETALRLFTSSNKTINSALVTLGLLAFLFFYGVL